LEIMSQTDETGLIATAQNIVNQACNSNISGAIAGVLTAAVKGLLGKSGVENNVVENYTISIGRLGGIERLDYRLSLKSFRSKTWKDSLSQVLSIVVVFSACKVKDMANNDTNVLLEQCFGELPFKIQNGMRQVLEVALDETIAWEERTEKEQKVILAVEKDIAEIYSQEKNSITQVMAKNDAFLKSLRDRVQ